MLKLSTRSRYGLRAMVQLASAWGGRPLMMREISESQNISGKYLSALLSELKAAGLLATKRGATGGYLLSRPPQDIRISEIVSALEGDIALVECVKSEELCEKSGECPARKLWARASEAIYSVLYETTLTELVASNTRATADRSTTSRRTGVEERTSKE